MTPLNGAMLGTGSISIHHLRAWRSLPDVRIVAFADVVPDRAVARGREYGTDEPRVYTDYRDLLAHEQIDFVDIATPPDVHREMVLAAAAHNVHVLCQKPFATSMAEAREMIRACESSGVRCVVNENWRWRSWYRDAKRMIEEGVIGTPRYARFQLHTDDVLPNSDGTLPDASLTHSAKLPRLILFNQGIHQIDVMRFLFGDIQRVYARMGRVSPLVQGEDMAVLLLEFRSDAIGIIDLSWGTRVPPEQRIIRGNLDPFWVEGELGTIEFDPYENDLILVTTSRGTERRHARGNKTPAEAYQDSYVNTQGHFLECLRSGAVAENEARDNMKTFATTMAAYESADRRAFIDVRVE